MLAQQSSKKNRIWLIPFVLGLALIQCNTVSSLLPPTPTGMLVNTEVSDLYASHSELLVGDTAEVGVGVEAFDGELFFGHGYGLRSSSVWATAR